MDSKGVLTERNQRLPRIVPEQNSETRTNLWLIITGIDFSVT